jgi:nitroimidazol reductase NimA-like FMN-containing flavoprotein (pyridoxamine 5'-phosphate oxidase superfamily)
MRQTLGELDIAQVEHMLKRRRIARLICQGDGLRYVGTVRYYALDLPDVYLHAPDADCVRVTHTNPSVRFEVDDVESPGRWESVVGWGTIEELHGASAPEGAGGAPGNVYRIHLDRVRGFYRGGPAAARHASPPG